MQNGVSRPLWAEKLQLKTKIRGLFTLYPGREAMGFILESPNSSKSCDNKAPFALFTYPHLSLLYRSFNLIKFEL